MLTCFASLQRDVPSPLPCTLPPTAVSHEDDKRAKRKGVGKADVLLTSPSLVCPLQALPDLVQNGARQKKWLFCNLFFGPIE